MKRKHYDNYDYDANDPIVINNSELSPIGQKKEKSNYDMSNLANINSPDFDQNLNYFASTIQPKQVKSFIRQLP